jgi:hypothetical protein
MSQGRERSYRAWALDRLEPEGGGVRLGGADTTASENRGALVGHLNRPAEDIGDRISLPVTRGYCALLTGAG